MALGSKSPSTAESEVVVDLYVNSGLLFLELELNGLATATDTDAP